MPTDPTLEQVSVEPLATEIKRGGAYLITCKRSDYPKVTRDYIEKWIEAYGATAIFLLYDPAECPLNIYKIREPGEEGDVYSLAMHAHPKPKKG
jgi:hypothetical protein